jgi:hypothetical protein
MSRRLEVLQKERYKEKLSILPPKRVVFRIIQLQATAQLLTLDQLNIITSYRARQPWANLSHRSPLVSTPACHSGAAGYRCLSLFLASARPSVSVNLAFNMMYVVDDEIICLCYDLKQ